SDLKQNVVLSEIDQSISDGCVTVRMKLHSLSDDVGYFMKPTIFHLIEGMQDPSLNRLQPVLNGRNRTFKDYVRSIIQKIIFIHSIQSDDFGCMVWFI